MIVLQGLNSSLLITQGFGVGGGRQIRSCVHVYDVALFGLDASDEALTTFDAVDLALFAVNPKDEVC